MLLMGDLLRRRAGSADAHRTALVFGDERWTYGRLNEAANRLANWLIAFGIRPGDRVALLGRNSAEWIVAYFAAAKAGAILVPASYWFKGDELRYVLSDSAVRLLIAERDFADLVAGERGGLPRLERVLWIGESPDPGEPSLAEVMAGAPGDEPELPLDER